MNVGATFSGFNRLSEAGSEWLASGRVETIRDHRYKDCRMGFHEDLQRRMDLIQRVFGREFLEKDVDSISNSRKRLQMETHPARILWSKAKQERRACPRGATDITPFTALERVYDLGSVLNVVAYLPGFGPQIRERLIKPTSFEDALYEARIARRHKGAGQDVRFVDTPGHTNKETDLRIFSGSHRVRVEAKFKDRITSLGSNDPYSELLVALQQRTLERCPFGLDITALVTGMPGEELFRAASEAVVRAVDRGVRGQRFLSDPGVWLRIDERTDRSQHGTDGAQPLPDAPRTWRVGPAAGGSVAGERVSTFGMLAMPGYAVTSIAHSVRTASKQIGPNGVGIVYVDVASMGRARDDLELYMRLIGAAASESIWSGGQHRRVKAIVLSTGPTLMQVTEDGISFNRYGYSFITVFQPGIAAPDEASAEERLTSVLGSASL